MTPEVKEVDPFRPFVLVCPSFDNQNACIAQAKQIVSIISQINNDFWCREVDIIQKKAPSSICYWPGVFIGIQEQVHAHQILFLMEILKVPGILYIDGHRRVTSIECGTRKKATLGRLAQELSRPEIKDGVYFLSYEQPYYYYIQSLDKEIPDASSSLYYPLIPEDIQPRAHSNKEYIPTSSVPAGKS